MSTLRPWLLGAAIITVLLVLVWEFLISALLVPVPEAAPWVRMSLAVLVGAAIGCFSAWRIRRKQQHGRPR